ERPARGGIEAEHLGGPAVPAPGPAVADPAGGLDRDDPARHYRHELPGPAGRPDLREGPEAGDDRHRPGPRPATDRAAARGDAARVEHGELDPGSEPGRDGAVT